MNRREQQSEARLCGWHMQYEALGMVSHYKVYEDLNTDY